MFGGFTFEVFGFAALSFMGVYMLLFLLYFIVLEGMWGATVGKMVAKIKVVREDGSACGIGSAVIRNVLRIVDALPFFYLIGLILISRSHKKQRLGDSLAKTVVVKSSQAQPIAAPAPTTPPTAPAATYAGSVPAAPGAVRFCIHCGAENPLDSKFCKKCGQKQE